jgi:hypothetical protein
VVTFLRGIKDFLSTYTWIELWIVVGVSMGMMGLWLLLSFQLSITNDLLRAASIWAVIFALTIGAATTDALRKHKG